MWGMILACLMAFWERLSRGSAIKGCRTMAFRAGVARADQLVCSHTGDHGGAQFFPQRVSSCGVVHGKMDRRFLTSPLRRSHNAVAACEAQAIGNARSGLASALQGPHRASDQMPDLQHGIHQSCTPTQMLSAIRTTRAI